MIQNLNLEINTSPLQSCVQKYMHLTGLSIEQTHLASDLIEFKATTYYLQLIDNLINNGKEEAAKCLLRSLMPNDDEALVSSEITDGIGEDNSVDGFPILSKFFPNRILLAINSRCPQYCRYCFRRRRLGKNNSVVTIKEVDSALELIKREISKSLNSGNIPIDEVILSGGEPLNISYNNLKHIVTQLCLIDEIKTVRIDTKLLSVKPEIFSPKLINLLSSCKTLYLVNHFIHPEEVTDIVIKKTQMLLNKGIIVGAHIPILHGINDDYSIIKELVNKLYFNKIRPYYLIQFIPTKWTEHFRVPLEQSLEIRSRLNKDCSGFSLPSLIVYLPGGKGKALIYSRRDIKKVDGGYLLYNTLNEEVFYEEKI